ncbi:phage integrase central domain-containing protein [Telmatospirillum sp.]|uniref:phage integrase central domain-containing protein n=1 Tax=Telmatospirillum sp. TaxID=2079197 RepID=UPI00284F3274|nr:hypothetical protein [Telmatospirillum sp.]MDR3439029.1 hypothetical protein [Telmatospirillum sp.]
MKGGRELASDVRKSVKAGTDPIERKKTVQVEEAKTPSFGTFADELIGTIESGFRNEKHIYQWRRTLGDTYCGSIRKKPIDAVTTDDILEILKPLWTTKQETASRLRGRIEKVLDAAKARGWSTGENPAQWRGHLDHLLPRRQKFQRGHQPAMPYD